MFKKDGPMMQNSDNLGTDERPVSRDENPFVAYVGALPAFSTVEEINAWIKDLREDDSGGDEIC
jgi:hypothetical protein